MYNEIRSGQVLFKASLDLVINMMTLQSPLAEIALIRSLIDMGHINYNTHVISSDSQPRCYVYIGSCRLLKHVLAQHSRCNIHRNNDV